MSDVEQWEHDEQRAMENEIISLREQVEKLTKERDALNFHQSSLIRSIKVNREGLEQQLASLAEQNGKMRGALEVVHAQLVDGKIFTQQVHRRPYWRYSVSEALSLPDLATPVLNRIRAEGMRMAAEICETAFAHGILQLGHRAAIAKAIRAKADELEAGVK